MFFFLFSGQFLLKSVSVCGNFILFICCALSSSMGDTDNIKSRDYALEVQKKVLSKMASKKFTKLLIDDKTSQALDEAHVILRGYMKSKKDASKLLKNLVKIIIKIAVLQRNDQFSEKELVLAKKMHTKLKTTALTLVSFYEVDFTFDQYVLSKHVNELRGQIHALIEVHLKDKSKERVNHVFDTLGDHEFLAALFNKEGPLYEHLAIVATCLKSLIEEGNL